MAVPIYTLTEFNSDISSDLASVGFYQVIRFWQPEGEKENVFILLSHLNAVWQHGA